MVSRKPLDLPPDVARRLAEDMRAYFAEQDGAKRDAIAVASSTRSVNSKARVKLSCGSPTSSECCGPIGDISHLLDHLVGAEQDRSWYVEAECLGCLEIDDQLGLGCLYHG